MDSSTPVYLRVGLELLGRKTLPYDAELLHLEVERYAKAALLHDQATRTGPPCSRNARRARDADRTSAGSSGPRAAWGWSKPRLRGGRGRNGIGRGSVGVDSSSRSASAVDEPTAVHMRMRGGWPDASRGEIEAVVGLGGRLTREQDEEARERHEQDQADDDEPEQPERW